MDNEHIESLPEPAPEERGEKRKAVIKFLHDVAETLILAVTLFLLINAVTARIRIQSISMQPTLFEGDFVLVNRLAYKFGSPSRGDVIVFRFPPDPQREPYIKRIIGLPGETIRVEGAQVVVNDVPLQETYLNVPASYQGSWQVPDGHLFVLGDNRNNSSDSHSWGMVPLDNVIGKAEIIYLPPAHWRLLSPRSAAAAGP